MPKVQDGARAGRAWRIRGPYESGSPEEVTLTAKQAGALEFVRDQILIDDVEGAVYRTRSWSDFFWQPHLAQKSSPVRTARPEKGATLHLESLD
jgi:hypothetical protein